MPDSIPEVLIGQILQQITDFVEGTPLADPDLGRIVRALRNAGLAMVVMGRGDAESVWQRLNDTEESLPDDVWNEIRSMWGWTDGWSAEPIMEAAWSLVEDAVTDANNGGQGEASTVTFEDFILATGLCRDFEYLDAAYQAFKSAGQPFWSWWRDHQIEYV